MVPYPTEILISQDLPFATKQVGKTETLSAADGSGRQLKKKSQRYGIFRVRASNLGEFCCLDLVPVFDQKSTHVDILARCRPTCFIPSEEKQKRSR